MTQIIPRHEPEIIAAEADKLWRGDETKVATTSLKELVVNGVRLSSRYGKADEYEAMSRIVHSLPAHLSPLISSIFCDSKRTLDYTITIDAGGPDQSAEIAGHVQAICRTLHGGHNGIQMTRPGGDEIHIEADWDLPDIDGA